MNLIYIRNHKSRKEKKFLKKKLKTKGQKSIYSIEAGDCCLAPAPIGKRDFMVTFLRDMTPEMAEYIFANIPDTITGIN